MRERLISFIDRLIHKIDVLLYNSDDERIKKIHEMKLKDDHIELFNTYVNVTTISIVSHIELLLKLEEVKTMTLERFTKELYFLRASDWFITKDGYALRNLDQVVNQFKIGSVKIIHYQKQLRDERTSENFQTTTERIAALNNIIKLNVSILKALER